MPKSTTSFLVDVNLWLAISYDSHIHHERAAEWFETIEAGQAFFCRLTQLSLLRLVTNPKVMGADVASQSSAWEIYDKLAGDLRVGFLPEPDRIEVTLRHLTRGPHHA